MSTEDEKTEITLFGGKVDIADAKALANALDDTADEGGRAGDVSFMSFSGKRGAYQIGVDKRVPEADEPFLVAITMFELGYMCWKGGKPVSKRMASVSAPKVAEPDPEEFGPFDTNKGEGWSRARAITARSMVNGEQVYFSINSKSGVATMSDLQRDVVARMKAGQDCWPVIVFGKEEFESQGFKNFKPTMDVIAWLSADDVNKLADPDIDPMSLLDAVDEAPAPEPVRRRKL